jgi:hypothetical protein
LVWMTLMHLPTHLSDLVNEPLGFVSLRKISSSSLPCL